MEGTKTCRVPQKGPVSGCAPRNETPTAHNPSYFRLLRASCNPCLRHARSQAAPLLASLRNPLAVIDPSGYASAAATSREAEYPASLCAVPGACAPCQLPGIQRRCRSRSVASRSTSAPGEPESAKARPWWWRARSLGPSVFQHRSMRASKFSSAQLRRARSRFLPVIAASHFLSDQGRIGGASRRLEGLPPMLAASIQAPRCRDLSEMHLQ
jgi:hypothetical protein